MNMKSIYLADLCHVLGILLLLRMAKMGRASCISLKSQELYLAVYVSRYLTSFGGPKLSLYYTLIRIFFVGSTALLIWIVRRGEVWHTAYNPTDDRLQHWKYILVPCIALGLVSEYVETEVLAKSGFKFDLDLLLTLSIHVEMVAMVPQLVLFRSTKFMTENPQRGPRYAILPPIFCFAAYKMLYVFNWLSLASEGRRYRHLYVVAACGVVQVLLYAPFFKFWYESLIWSPKRKDREEQSEVALITNVV